MSVQLSQVQHIYPCFKIKQWGWDDLVLDQCKYKHLLQNDHIVYNNDESSVTHFVTNPSG